MTALLIALAVIAPSHFLGNARPAWSWTALSLGGGVRDALPPEAGSAATGVIAGFGTTVTTGSFAVSGANKVLFACVYNVNSSGSQVTTGCTWDPGVSDEAFTSLVTQGTEPGDAGNISWWYLVNPTNTTATVSCGITDSSTSIAHAILVTNAKQSAPTLTNTAQSNPASAGLTSTVDNTLMLTCAGDGNNSGTYTHGAGQDELSDLVSGGGAGITSATSEELKATAGTETLTSTADPSATSRYVVIGIEPVP